MITRRNLLRGLVVAPAIIAIDRLMPLSFERRSSLILPYKGKQLFDVGAFYCPYVPIISFKTRYGVVVPLQAYPSCYVSTHSLI